MFNKLSNKELVTVTQDLAKTLGADTPLLDIAKLLAESAMRLDVAIVRGNELQRQLDATDSNLPACKAVKESWKKRAWTAEEALAEQQKKLDAVVAENAALKGGFLKRTEAVEHWNSWADAKDKITLHIETTTTDAILNAVRAEGINFAAIRMLAAWESGFINDTPEQAYDITGGFLTALEFLPNASPEELTGDYHSEVLSAIAKSRSADAAKDGE